jgi:predicted transcriptional regulator of viral defense system
MSTIFHSGKSLKSERVVAALRKAAVMRSRDLIDLGISREYLSKLCKQGIIERVARGLYRLPNAEISAQHTMVEAVKRVPHGVICLLSALRFHGLTTQSPFEVWLAINVKARLPKTDIPIRVVRFSGSASTEGIEQHLVEGVKLRVYSIAKTVADCFKYRNKIGLEVALEALREAQRSRRASMDDFWLFAKVCRVTNIMRPYLEVVR